MALTAREWTLLPKDEMEARQGELSPGECFKLRTELSMIHLTEEQKARMTEEEKNKFINQKYPKRTEEEKREIERQAREVFRSLLED
ncbi:hypothetical protein ASU35_05965 [Acetivibrio ethanolgignens]|uniref:Uncharacterized protein n=2 Tax=Acetivibrio ethanolgignens TaxID=290052 RepID=A0A0V8QIB0_9FIRM|nr:hypothetical protein ASU35_05965 [Acetivibrio ethanolgignens]